VLGQGAQDALALVLLAGDEAAACPPNSAA